MGPKGQSGPAQAAVAVVVVVVKMRVLLTKRERADPEVRRLLILAGVEEVGGLETLHQVPAGLERVGLLLFPTTSHRGG
jgi:hypothetical protein